MQLHRLEPVPPARLQLQRAPPNLMSEAEAAELLSPRPEGCGDLGVCVTGAVVVDCGPGEACAEFGPTATPLPTSLPEQSIPAMSRNLTNPVTGDLARRAG